MYRLGLDMEWHPMAHLKGNVCVSCFILWHYMFCSFVYFFITTDFVLTNVFHRFFVAVFLPKTPMFVGCLLTEPTSQAGSSLTEAGFASIDAAFPGGVWNLGSTWITHQDDITFVRKNLESLRNLNTCHCYPGWGWVGIDLPFWTYKQEA